MSGKHNFEKKGQNIIINFEGFYGEDEAKNFVQEYTKAVKGLDTKNATLILNGQKLKTASAELLPILKDCFVKYDQEFKKVVLVNPTAITAKLQMRRIAKEANVAFDFVDKYPCINEI